jgi:phosphoribosylamine--glycine ligase
MSERNVLIVGGGGREHQLGLSLANSVDNIYFAPGNAGTAAIENGTNLSMGPSDLDGIVAFVKERDCELTVVGPEQPLVDGLADQLEGHKVFGPSAEAAKLEGSKAFAVRFMREFGIPHPASDIIDNEVLKTRALLAATEKDVTKYVIKADGLAGGKGVVLPATQAEASDTLKGMFSGELFGGAGKECTVIQERLRGPEVSVFVISDGENFITLPLSQDHKRLKDNDEGPNTGGMGAYAPVPKSIFNSRQKEKIDEIVEKSIAGARLKGMPYKGVLYIGLMLAEEYDGDPVVMEYNVRFGDPEAQGVLPLLDRAGVDTYSLLHSSAEGNLRTSLIPEIGGAALTVCLAAEGYPDSPRKGDTIYGLNQNYPNVIIQHGGTKQQDENIVTAGGRVLYVTGLGETVTESAVGAYAAIGEHGIHFDGMQYRTDIGHQARP